MTEDQIRAMVEYCLRHNPEIEPPEVALAELDLLIASGMVAQSEGRWDDAAYALVDVIALTIKRLAWQVGLNALWPELVEMARFDGTSAAVMLANRDLLGVAIALDMLLRMPVQMQVCRKCGCTDRRGCGDGCQWVADDLCSACEDAGVVAGAPVLVDDGVTQGDALGCDGAALQAAGTMGVDHDC